MYVYMCAYAYAELWESKQNERKQKEISQGRDNNDGNRQMNQLSWHGESLQKKMWIKCQIA